MALLVIAGTWPWPARLSLHARWSFQDVHRTPLYPHYMSVLDSVFTEDEAQMIKTQIYAPLNVSATSAATHRVFRLDSASRGYERNPMPLLV
jgi:hypothetical protein